MMDILRNANRPTGRIFNRNTVNIGSIDSASTFGSVDLDKNDPSLECVVHVFSLGLINNLYSTSIYGRAGMPLFVTKYPESVQDSSKITYYSGVVDLWVPSYIDPEDGHVYFDDNDIAALNPNVNPNIDNDKNTHAIVEVIPFTERNHTILKIPHHDFQLNDDIQISLPSDKYLELRDMASEKRTVLNIINDRVTIDYSLPDTAIIIDKDAPPRAKYEFYTQEEEEQVQETMPPLEFMGLTGRLQPGYQVHASNSIYLVASVLQGLTPCYMQEDQLGLFLPGDRVYMYMHGQSTRTMIKYSPFDSVEAICIGTFISRLQTPTGEYASISTAQPMPSSFHLK